MVVKLSYFYIQLFINNVVYGGDIIHARNNNRLMLVYLYMYCHQRCGESTNQTREITVTSAQIAALVYLYTYRQQRRGESTNRTHEITVN